MGLFSEIVVVTSQTHQAQVQDHLKSCHITLPVQIICEPCRKNTAPAIALAMAAILSQSPDAHNEVICVFPSDHRISDTDLPLLAQNMELAGTLAQSGSIVTFGIIPTQPETGYGYIQVDQPVDISTWSERCHFPVSRFVEKPPLETAITYIQSQKYLWNSGMFAFTPTVMLDELARHCPEIYRPITEKSYPAVLAAFDQMPSVSIDYAVMEHTHRAQVIPLNMGWTDLGSWESVFQCLPKTLDNNLLMGLDATSFHNMDASHNLCFSTNPGKHVAAVDIHNLIIVDTPHALLIAQQGQSQRIKNLEQPLLHPNIDTKHHDWGHLTIEWHGAYETSPAKNDVCLVRLVIHPNQQIIFPNHSGALKALNVMSGAIHCKQTQEHYHPGDTIILTSDMVLETGSPPTTLFYVALTSFLEYPVMAPSKDDARLVSR
jgi:mannose-1-phosphate guanylyltransferase/mannose-6-phosphate isomerase